MARLLRWLAATAVVVMALAPAQPAHAGEKGQSASVVTPAQLGTGEQSRIVGTPQVSAEDLAELARKDAEASDYYAKLMEVKRAVGAGDMEAAERALAELGTLTVSGGASAEEVLAACADDFCESDVVSRILQVTQSNSYYCGPATLRSLVMGKISISQVTAANRLGTTTAGTDWYDGTKYPFEYALDYYLGPRGGANYYPVALPGSPTSTQKQQYRGRLTSDVYNDWGIAGDAWEAVGGPHLVGHPTNREIFHWFAIRGYANWGASTRYADSVHGASSISWSGSVPVYSTMSSDTIVTIMGGRGYVW